MRKDVTEVFNWVKRINKCNLHEVVILNLNVRTSSSKYKIDIYKFRNDIGTSRGRVYFVTKAQTIIMNYILLCDGWHNVKIWFLLL